MTNISRVSRILLLVLGVGLGLFALAAPGLEIEGIEATSVGQILLLCLSLLLVVIGIVGDQQVLQRGGKLYQVTALLLLNTCLLLVFIESVAVIGWNVFIHSIPQDRLIIEPPDMEYYQSMPWGEQYWSEFYQVGAEVYESFTVWTRAPFSGETINIDANGIRQTVGGECTEDAYTVFMLGGSTLWGYGVPDDMTIASYVQAGLAQARETPVCVTNFGEVGYVSTQEIIRLMKELQAGHTPDLVIFYDGLNETAAAWQSGKAGTHQNLAPITSRFHSLAPHPLVQWIRQSYTMRIIGVFAGGPGGSVPRDVPTEDLANDVVGVYNVNRRIVAGLASEYGFDYLFVWQPTITTTQKPLNGEEQKFLQAIDSRLRDLDRAVYALMAETQDEHFYNLMDAGDEFTGQLWFDTSHIIPPGNQIIASRILERLNAQE